MRRRLGQLTLLLVFGFVCAAIGGRIENNSEPPAPAAPQPTRVVVDKQVEHVPVLPEPCRRAFELAVKLRAAAESYDTTTGPQVDVMNQAEKEIFARDYQALNDLITRQRAIRDATVTAADTMHRELVDFNRLLRECDTELGG
jgi:hypothetical protein